MAKVKISDLDAAAALDGTELIEGEQDGGSVKMTAQDIADLAAAPYLKYVALLSQTGTDAPVATVLENTLGGTVVWSYSGEGAYIGTLAATFTANKTTISCSQTSNGVVICGRDNDSEVYINTKNSSFGGSDDQLYGSVIEIRVYP